jgi:PAS domain S-box-containing protein
MNKESALAKQLPAGEETADLAFLQGGGECGARMRAVDWSATALGAPQDWPRSLKTIVRMMLDSRYAMWMLWGPQLTFFCNDSYLPTVGIKRDWVMGSRSDHVWAEIWPDIGPRIDHVMTRGEATWDEGLLLYLERSGFPEETYHTFSYSPVYDDDNRIAGMLCVVTETTQRVQAERGLGVLRDLAARSPGSTVQQALSRTMEVLQTDDIDVPFAALYLVDNGRDEAMLVANFGVAPDVLSTDRIAMAGQEDGALLRVLVGGAAELLDLQAAGASVPSPLWPEPVTRALILPLRGANNAVSGALVMGLSSRRRLDPAYRQFFELVAGQISAVLADAQAYESERHRAESLAELDRAKTRFFSNVSHEFRTPLTLMLGPLDELLDDPGLAPATRERLVLAQRNAHRLLGLVNSLLDFSRIEAGRALAAYQPTDLAVLTRDIASTFRSAVERAGLEFDVQAPPLPSPVWVDHEMWEKIVLNLLSNAFKFTLQGAIRVRVTALDGNAVLEVADTGVGVPEDALPRLFERFYRVENSGGRTHEGSGIGLALVQELVRLHGGTIGVSSRAGHGTSFIVKVPFGQEHLPAERLGYPPESAGSRASAPRSREVLAWGESGPQLLPQARPDLRFESTFGSRVLLVDDNADMRAYVAGLLSPAYQVHSAPDGQAALEAVRIDRPDIIVSDIMMPRLDGFGLIRSLRADATLRDVPVILLSARAGEEARIDGLDAGADDYLVKPFSAREITARVGALLERSRLHHRVVETQRQRGEQFQTLLAEAPLGMFLVDDELRIIDVNPTALPAFGQDASFIGENFRQVVKRIWSPDYALEIIGRFEQTLRTGERYASAERVETRADGKTVEAYDWQISRIPLPDGSFGVVCFFRDVTVQVSNRRQLENADRQKDDFLAMLAHELRNPLAPIRTASELLKRRLHADEHAQAAIDVVRRQARHLMRLVDDLLDISRITRARIELKRQDISLEDVISQALETVEPMLQEKGQHLTTISERARLHVNGDPARLVQCVANLLTNAIKYTDPGGRISVDWRAEDDQAVIVVSDNGPGIAPDLLPEIFDLFVQSKRTLDRSQGGLGIGLSVVKRLVEMHGGTVEAFSQGPGCGARFTIRLPSVGMAQPRAVHAPSVPALPRRVLIVDDNRDAAESLALLLALDGHDTRAVFTPEDALRCVSEQAFDVMLLDIGLPGMDGYEVARRTRGMQGLERMRLVALTGYGQAEDRQRALDAGFDAHLVKPVEPERLQQVLMS